MSEIERIVSTATPFSSLMSQQYKWKIFSSPMRLIYVMLLVACMLFIELNTFLMMNTMGIPHDSVYNKVR